MFICLCSIRSKQENVVGLVLNGAQIMVPENRVNVFLVRNKKKREFTNTLMETERIILF